MTLQRKKVCIVPRFGDPSLVIHRVVVRQLTRLICGYDHDDEGRAVNVFHVMVLAIFVPLSYDGCRPVACRAKIGNGVAWRRLLRGREIDAIWLLDGLQCVERIGEASLHIDGGRHEAALLQHLLEEKQLNRH